MMIMVVIIIIIICIILLKIILPSPSSSYHTTIFQSVGETYLKCLLTEKYLPKSDPSLMQ